MNQITPQAINEAMLETTAPAAGQTATPLRIIILVTHLLGVGHLTRAAALGRALATRGHAVQLISGGAPAPLLKRGSASLIQLPPLHVTGTAFSDLRESDGGPLRPETARQRIALISEALQRQQPHVLITELYPFGRRALASEFQAALDTAARLPRPPIVLASVRDILARPAKQGKIDAAHAMLRAYYDGVLVHADPAVVPLDASWPIADDLRPRLHYTGYVDDATSQAPPVMPCPSGEIIVSGGGSAAALPLLRAALAAATADPQQRIWRLLVGHKVAADVLEGLKDASRALSDQPGSADRSEFAQTRKVNAIVERARPDFRDLLRGCAASVSQFGYNTALDILATGAPAVVVPFAEGGETEQNQRAELFAARGLVASITLEQAVDPATLLAAIEAAQTAQQKTAQRTAPHHVAVDGAERAALIIEKLASSLPAKNTQMPAPVLTAPDPMLTAPDPMLAAPAITPLGNDMATALRPVAAALDRAADHGQTIAFWHRDDDAIAPTPQLERLLQLSHDHGAPLALAVIPTTATQALADRLKTANDVCVLVHGLSHENLAPADDKNGEFSHGDPAQLALRAAQGLTRIKELFGAQARAVLTPPWNRISPALLPLLSGAGFVGLSTFKERPAPFAAPGLSQVNTHIDPIAWRHDRSLVDPAALAATICEGIARRCGPEASDEPLGLLTHHLVHDARIDAFVACLLGLITAHPAARMVAIDEALPRDP